MTCGRVAGGWLWQAVGLMEVVVVVPHRDLCHGAAVSEGRSCVQALLGQDVVVALTCCRAVGVGAGPLRREARE